MTAPLPEYPPRADLFSIQKPLPKIPPGTVDQASLDNHALAAHATEAVGALNAALSSNNIEQLAGCFYEQAYWRDSVAFTSHLRTLDGPRVVAAALLHTVGLRGLADRFEETGNAELMVISPSLTFIDLRIAFQTSTPALRCLGRILLLPVKVDDKVTWKIWVLSTWVEELVQFPEDTALLSLPGANLKEDHAIHTDVLIIGAGTSGLTMAARLKALGVESVILDRNANIGDNWANRYDAMNFHLPTSSCEMPYKYYRKELQSPHLLLKNDIAEHIQEYAKDFHLNVLTSSVIKTTVFDTAEKQWTMEVEIAESKTRTIVCKHLVQSTGLVSGKPRVPTLQDEHLYTGLSMHSTQFRNAQELKDRGVKTVAIIGSANTAFDIMEDCVLAGLETTMVVRSPTYILPYDHVTHPKSHGAYDIMPVHAVDQRVNTLPIALGSQFAHALFARLAAQEPDRYTPLTTHAFPVLTSTHPRASLLHHILERGGGHYIDVGGTAHIAAGRVHIRALVHPVSFTPAGLALSDGTLLPADAVLFCTGFADANVRDIAASMLGVRPPPPTLPSTTLLGPEDIAARLDASWGLDAEGEVRGVWKRHRGVDNYWVMGGAMGQQRWYSRPVAQMVKLALLGELPEAWRGTPGVG